MDHDNLQIRLLGRVRLRRHGEDQFIGTGRRAAVLAVLAIEGSASREQIVAAVWGDDPPASVNGNVYTHVNALRDVLGDRMLTHADGVYRLNLTEQAVDALRFEALRRQARRHRVMGEPLVELALLQESLGLWDGDALAGVPGPFAGAHRARLHELRLAGEQRLAEVLLDLDRHDEAIARLRPLVTAHPLQESLHRLLMTALHAGGQRDEALRVYEDLSAFLLRTTGTEPTAELRRTREHIEGGPRPGHQRAHDVLRAVAFLGDGATIGEICQVTGLPRSAVNRTVETVRAEGVLTTSSGTVAFRDPATARALYDSTPEVLRRALHGFFAAMIADSFGPAERVAAQLLRADPAPLDPTASRWLLEHVDQLALRSPGDAIALLQRAHLQHMSDRDVHVALSVWLARLLFGQGRDAVPQAGWVAARTRDPDVQAEMLWIAACSHDSQGQHVAAAEIARSALSTRRYAQPWLERFRNLILRLRLRLPGVPTEAHHDRSAVVSANKLSVYRRAIAPDGPRW